MMTILFIILLSILLLTSFYVIYNLYNKTEVLNNIIASQQQIQEDVLSRMENTIDELREIDLRGAFEADDEVGITWKMLKDIINVLNTDVIEAFNNKDINYAEKNKKD